ncbi:hypothetical protein KBY96_14580 [Cyanobium sp. ATX 6A2]|uniref:hypothetical protein n=1 Tax=Cyanobium sp. ATX 6A2 TaxID=2823700 RepID=UPI0020CD6027|nr:hypothetical protein [Cyanobium sp. ATX 6A2]MCP9889145.1 hypothetical protein [Cyanobium sp. ATX 6A2]
MQESKAVPHRYTDLGTKLNISPCLAANHGPNVSLNQVHDAVGHAAGLGIQQDALLTVQLANNKELPPPMGLQARKHCPRGDQDINGIKIPLQVIELAAYGCLYCGATGLLLLGNSKEVGTSLLSVIAWPVFT